MPKQVHIELIHASEPIIVINKPAGLLSIPDRYDKTKPSAYVMLQEQVGEVYIVHRLDKDTSGVLCFARTPEMHATLNAAFEAHTVEKTYWCITEAIPVDEEGEIDLPIAHSLSDTGLMVISRKGKDSKTHYKVLEHFGPFGLLEVKPLTGRTHQIRVHLQAIGCPIIADPFYGKRPALFIQDIKRKGYKGDPETQTPLMARTCLHAKTLDLPIDGVHFFESELPKDFKACLNQLRKLLQ